MDGARHAGRNLAGRSRRSPGQVGAGLQKGKQELERLARQGKFKLGGQRKLRGKNLGTLGSESGKKAGTEMSTTQAVLDTDELCINTMRTLAGDASTPMGMSPTVYCLWQRLLRFDPEDPIWMNRDRFVLSAGHASTLLYTILHLARVKAVDPEYEILGRPSVTLEDIK